MTRVFVLGLDAASPQLLQRWTDRLPTFRRLMEEGTWGTLHSTRPPFTSPAWSCMLTGKNPAKVGIFGLRHRREGTYRFAAPTSGQRLAPSVWELAGEAGRDVIVVNVPDTYPPTPVNGVLISGRPAPVEHSVPITYPTDLRAHIDRACGGYRIGPAAEFEPGQREDEFHTWQDVLERQERAVDHLLESRRWDLAIYVSMAIDGISHHYWKDLDPNHPDHDPQAAGSAGNVMLDTYRLEDQRLGRFLERLSPEDVLLVVSDHGSAPCYHHIAVNLWLIQQGYLVLKDPPQAAKASFTKTLARAAFDLYRQSATLRRLARPLRRSRLRDTVVHAQFARRTGGRIPLDALSIDWERTTAYYLGDDRVYLNLQGREPAGTVMPGADYRDRREGLRQDLLAARHPETGEPLFAAVHTREEIYAGPYLDQGPDLLLVPGNDHWNLGGAVGTRLVDRPVVSGKHHPKGMLLAWGKDVQAGGLVEAAIYDIAPTILHMLGLAIPEDTDGRVRRDWFDPDSSTARRPVESVQVPARDAAKYAWTSEEEAAVESRLRDLGYLD